MKPRFATDVLKIVWVFFWAASATVLVFFPITVTALLSRTGNLAFKISKLWAMIMLVVMGVRPKIRGRVRINRAATYVIVSNHQSFLDILALVTTLGVQFRWVIKAEILKVPLFGYALYASRNIFVDRSNREKSIESIRKGLVRLPDSVSLLVFPEGTRSPDGKIRKFKKGAFNIAIERSLPLLPVTVNGSHRLLPKGTALFKPGTLEVVVGDPIETAAYGRKHMDALIERTRNAIIENYNPRYAG